MEGFCVGGSIQVKKNRWPIQLVPVNGNDEKVFTMRDCWEPSEEKGDPEKKKCTTLIRNCTHNDI